MHLYICIYICITEYNIYIYMTGSTDRQKPKPSPHFCFSSAGKPKAAPRF